MDSCPDLFDQQIMRRFVSRRAIPQGFSSTCNKFKWAGKCLYIANYNNKVFQRSEKLVLQNARLEFIANRYAQCKKQPLTQNCYL